MTETAGREEDEILGEEDEIDLSSCPYYRGIGTCEYGCYSEPSCMTDEPHEGWPSRRLSSSQSPAVMGEK